jgi:hypothetical protein
LEIDLVFSSAFLFHASSERDPSRFNSRYAARRYKIILDAERFTDGSNGCISPLIPLSKSLTRGNSKMPDHDLKESSLSLKELIRRVQIELMESQGEREARGDAPLFEVESLTLEVNFVVTRSKGGSGGFEFKVLTFGGINVGGDVERQEQQTHKITLSLKAIPGSFGDALCPA